MLSDGKHNKLAAPRMITAFVCGTLERLLSFYGLQGITDQNPSPLWSVLGP